MLQPIFEHGIYKYKASVFISYSNLQYRRHNVLAAYTHRLQQCLDFGSCG